MRGLSPSQKYYKRRFKTQSTENSIHQNQKGFSKNEASLQQTKLKHPSSPILVLKIDMEDGRIEDLRIHSQDELPIDCENFCAKYSLAADFKDNLVIFCKKELESISVTIQTRLKTEPEPRPAVPKKASKKPKLTRKSKPATATTQKSATQRNLKTMPTPVHQAKLEAATRDAACLGSSRRVTSKTSKNLGKKPNKDIFDRLWLDATQGKSYRELVNKKKFQKIYPFEPNLNKQPSAAKGNKSTLGNKTVSQVTEPNVTSSSQNLGYDCDKNFGRRKNISTTYDHRGDHDLDVGDKLAKTSYDQFFMVNNQGWSRSKETYRNQRKFKSNGYANEFYDRLTYQGIKSPSHKSNQKSTYQPAASKLNSQLQTSYYYNMKTLGNTENVVRTENSVMSSQKRLHTTDRSMSQKGRGSGSNNKSTISGRQSKLSWMRKDDQFSFHPSIKHDKSYDSSTPYEKSLSRIREKYSRNKDSIYGVNLDNKLYENKGITEIERIQSKSKRADKSRNRRNEKIQLENKFSKLIALASLFSCGEATIKIGNIDKLLQSQMAKCQLLSPQDFNSSTASVLSGNRNMNAIINEIGMSQIYEITPFDFIEFIKNKNLTDEAAKAYEFLMASQVKKDASRLEKSITSGIEELRSVELGSRRDGMGVWSASKGSTCKTAKNMISTLATGETNRSQYINFKRAWTWKEGRAQEKDESLGKWKCQKITPKYMELLERQNLETGSGLDMDIVENFEG